MKCIGSGRPVEPLSLAAALAAAADMVINDMIGNHMPCEGTCDDVAFSWLISC